MNITPLFPEDRRRDPVCRAEMQIYDLLAKSNISGRALYEVSAAH